jgi:hypothetical protein
LDRDQGDREAPTRRHWRSGPGTQRGRYGLHLSFGGHALIHELPRRGIFSETQGLRCKELSETIWLRFSRIAEKLVAAILKLPPVLSSRLLRATQGVQDLLRRRLHEALYSIGACAGLRIPALPSPGALPLLVRAPRVRLSPNRRFRATVLRSSFRQWWPHR